MIAANLQDAATIAASETNGETTMKKLILGVALAVVAASPVLAQPVYSHRSVERLEGIRAQAMPSLNSGAVFVDGQYTGVDPDANVRQQLSQGYQGILNH